MSSFSYEKVTDHPLYSTWNGIVQRCTNPNFKQWEDYGGRGITVCDEWRNDSKVFLDYVDSELGPKPTRKHSIDRIDNDKGYEPGNIRWMDPSGQQINKRTRSDNTSGHVGVRWVKNRWRAGITVYGVPVYLGRFKGKQDAIDAYHTATAKYYKSPTDKCCDQSSERGKAMYYQQRLYIVFNAVSHPARYVHIFQRYGRKLRHVQTNYYRR
jgi:hypothetical protein